MTEEEDPGVAEEATDQAPPAELPEEGQDNGTPAAAEDQGQEQGQEQTQEGGDQEEAPPAPAQRTNAAPAANAALRQRLINRVRNV